MNKFGTTNPKQVHHIKIPRVFKIFQQTLNIENEWAVFKKNLWNHKYKVSILTTILFYPFYNEKLQRIMNYYRIILNTRIEDTLSKEKPITQVGQGFLKHFVVNALKDEYVKEGGLVYVQDLIKERRIIDGSVQMLLATIKEKEFLDMVKQEGKILGQDLLKDKDIQKDLATLTIDTLKDPVVKFELLDQCRVTQIQPEIKKSIGELFNDVFGEPRVQQSMKKLLEDGMTKIMAEQDTVDKARVFMYNLANSEMNSKELANKSLLEMMVNRTMHKCKKDLDLEYKRFIKLNQQNNNTEYYRKNDVYNPELQPDASHIDRDLVKNKGF